ncbi:MAG: TIGR01212 family radical SAM protein [Syntrophomonadaceae bacterium]|nr:TIGR01212 family radical SAM protein [Syntrophomonadaceae bacterium]
MKSHYETRREWGDKRYHSLNFFLREKFGHKVFKIPLDAGFTCPNRDGTLSTRGCLFCSAAGAGDFAGNREDSISQQFTEVTETMHKKWSEGKYIAYFQAFTNTYAPISVLRELYYKALQQPGVIGLAIATRPDCLNTQVLDLLEEIKAQTYLWVELGLQTIHKKTSDRMNLHYNCDNFQVALNNLKNRDIPVVAHIILGLPGESHIEMQQTGEWLANQPIQGLKIHLLHLMKNTQLAYEYKNRPFHFLTQSEYADLVIDCLEILSPDVVIHRLTGDSPRALLIGPEWSLNKWETLNYIDQRLLERDTWQGKYFNTDISAL